ncbi:IPT/TIG domain-containing protein [bacterium]|nr:IPT/TIG domain-containing protein [bacterium]
MAKDKNKTGPKDAMLATTRTWAALFHFLFFVFIGLFFSSSIDAFEIHFPAEEKRDEYVRSPIIYQDTVQGIQIASLLTKKDSEYKYLFVLPPTEPVNTSWIRFYFDDKKEIAFETEFALPGLGTINTKNNHIEMFRYPLYDGASWEQEINDIEFALSGLLIEGQTIKFGTTVKAESIEVSGKSIEVLHVETQARGDISGFLVELYQHTWLNENDFPVQRFFEIYISGNLTYSYKIELDSILNKMQLLILPDQGAPAGGTRITIVGGGFTEDTEVTIGNQQLQNVEFNEDTKLLTTYTPPGEGTVPVITTNADGEVLKGEFTYTSAFEIFRVTPNRGSPSEETVIIIEGIGFEPKAIVKFDGQKIGSSYVNSKVITAFAPELNSGARAGFRDVTVVNPDGRSTTKKRGFEYVDVPNIEKIEPPGGSPEGGTVITVTGTGFNENTTVRIGGALLKDKQVSGTTTIKGKVPPGNEGWQDVSVANGDLQTVIHRGFCYCLPPTVEMVEPVGGNPKGGTYITITGTGFWERVTDIRTIVTVGGKNASDIQVWSATKIIARTPEGDIGFQKVVVKNPDGQSSSQEINFTYNPPPSIDNISPPSGKLTGGTEISIIGTGFIEEISGQRIKVKIGEIDIKDINFISDTKLIVTTPGYTKPGDVLVIVTNPDEQYAEGTFTYNPLLPIIKSISPPNGKLAGGTQITITGDNFIEKIQGVEEKLTIAIGNIEAENVQFISANQLTATTPARNKPGDVEVIISNPDGQQAEATFTYNPLPNITSVSPPSGKLTGGTQITITGTGFIKEILGVELTVTIGEIDAKILQFSSTQLTAITPARNKPGDVEVIISNPDGQQAKTTFTYNPLPNITSVSPPSGKLTGGTQITITGTGFIKEILGVELTVTIGEIDAKILQFSSNQLTAITPARNQFGDVEVIISNPDGQQAKTTFTYNSLPNITSVSPPSGRIAGGTQITITGGNFIEKIQGVEEKLTITIDGTEAENVQFISSNHLTAITPVRNEPGDVEVIVTNPDSQQAKATFTYNFFPNITGISPLSGKLAGGTEITITGKNFIQTIPGEEKKLTVTIGGTVAESVFFSSNQKLLVTTPARPEPGEFEVIVINPDGQQDKGTFTYNPLPIITNISPSSGKLVGGTQITITGDNFRGEIQGVEEKLTITIGGIEAQDVQFISSNQLTATTPARNEPGAVEVIINNPDGQQARGTFTYNAIPVITSISPPSGKLAGGTIITITGTGFIQGIPGVEAKLTVMIGDVEVPITFDSQISEQTQLISANRLTVITPKRNQPGKVDVIVTNPDGQEAKGTYTYNPLLTITSISPPSGKVAGGTRITITGTGFIEQILDKRLSIQIGDVDVTANIESILPTQIVFTTPAGTEAKTVDVIITNPDEQEISTKFIYNPFPTIQRITPDRGIGGTEVTISGSNFIEKISNQYIRLKIGDLFVGKITSVSSEEITFTAPVYGIGSFPIIVINPDGQESQQVINFTYNPPPVITDILPPTGRIDGGTSIIIRGTGFICEIPGIQVKIGSKLLEIECSSTELRFTTPSNSEPGKVDIIVTNPDGQQAQGKFTYTPAPIVHSVNPKVGNPEGDTRITIEGENFLENILERSIKVKFGEHEAQDISRHSDTEITARTPPETPGRVVSVIVIGPDGQSSSGDIKFTYNDDLKISSIFPNMLPPAGGAEVIVSGTGFTKEKDIPFDVWFGDVEAEVLQVESSTRLKILAPPGTTGTIVDVTIENDDRQEFTLRKGFRYTDRLAASKISPTIGPANGGTEVVINGSGFIKEIGEQEIEVTFGVNPGNIVSIKPTQIIVRTPSGENESSVEVIVTGPDGQKATLGSRFYYIDFPEGALVYNYPNPTPVGRGTTFRFSDNSANVEIKIFNMAGVLVQSLHGNGGNMISWDGKDRFGNVVRFGLYPYVYLVDGKVKQGQLLHIRSQR